MNNMNKETEDGYYLWTFKEILNHRVRKKGKTSWMEVKVLWDTHEENWEPLNVIKADDPITVAKYVEANGLIDKPRRNS